MIRIVSKFHDEARLSQSVKDLYPEWMGQIFIPSSVDVNIHQASDFVNLMRRQNRIAPSATSESVTLVQAMSMDEVHVVIGSRRIIVRP